MTDSIQPVEPLGYFDGGGEPMLPMIRLMSLAAMVWGGIEIVSSILSAGMAVWANIFKWVVTGSTWWVAAQLPSGIANLLLFFGGLISLRLQMRGRKMIVAGSITAIGAAALVFASEVIKLAMSSHSAPLSGKFAAYSAASIAFSSLANCVLPALLWIFFTRIEVRKCFRATSE